jgi:hypothetical protein
MSKLAWFARFRPGITGVGAQREWAGKAVPLVAKVPALTGFVQSEAVGPHPSVSGASEEEVFFDGYGCAWFAGDEQLERAIQSAEWEALLESSSELFDRDWQRGMTAVVEELTLKEGERSPFKAVWVLRFRNDIDREWARDFWANDHARFVIEAPGVDRYLQNHVVAAVGSDDSSLAPVAAVGYDGFAECWFQDRAAFIEAVTSPQWEGLVADGANLFDMSFLWGAVVEEHVVKAAP